MFHLLVGRVDRVEESLVGVSPVREGCGYQGPLWSPPIVVCVLVFWWGVYVFFGNYLRGKTKYSSGNYSGFLPDLRFTAC